jgi:hypothetical protein
LLSSQTLYPLSGAQHASPAERSSPSPASPLLGHPLLNPTTSPLDICC